MNYSAVNSFCPYSRVEDYNYYREVYGEDHDFPAESWTGYIPSTICAIKSAEEVVDYLLSGVVLGFVETEYAVTIYDCSGMPVARLKKSGSILGPVDNTDQVLVSKIAEIYAQLSNESMLSA